jgi:hypothetical protein
MKIDARKDSVQCNDIVTMVDVDYYIDMNKHLAMTPVPHILYTFQPWTTGADRGEYNYSFHANDQVQYSLEGATAFKHKLWNYQGDTIHTTTALPRLTRREKARQSILSYPEIPKWESRHVSRVWRINKRFWQDERDMVLLTPQSVAYGFDVHLAKALITIVDLTRYRVVMANLRACASTRTVLSTSQLHCWSVQ